MASQPSVPRVVKIATQMGMQRGVVPSFQPLESSTFHQWWFFFSLDDWDFIIEPMSASEFTRISIRTGCFWHESRFTIGFESQRSIKIHHSEWCGKPNAINHPQITIFMGCINKPQLVVVYGIGFLSLFTISLSINNHYLESSWSLVY